MKMNADPIKITKETVQKAKEYGRFVKERKAAYLEETEPAREFIEDLGYQLKHLFNKNRTLYDQLIKSMDPGTATVEADVTWENGCESVLVGGSKLYGRSIAHFVIPLEDLPELVEKGLKFEDISKYLRIGGIGEWIKK